MHRRTRLLASVGLFVLALAPSALAEDVLVWQPTADGYQTSWIIVDGASVKKIATRAEAVVSDGTRLWAARITKRSIPMYPCEMLDDESIKAAPDGHFDWPSLNLLELTGSSSQKVVEDWGKETFFGEVWSKHIRLVGGFGPNLLVDHVNTMYACGAHGNDDSNRFVWNAGLNETKDPEMFIKDIAKTNAKAHPALLKLVKAEECYEEELSDNSLHVDGLTLSTSGGKVAATAVYLHPTPAEWRFDCTLEYPHELSAAEVSRQIAPTQAIETALKALKIKGTVGYASLNLTGRARALALDAFKTRALPTAKRSRANADAAPFVAKGRKLTKQKKYAEAIAAFDTAIRNDPKAARAWSGRGYAKLLAGQLDKAARDFNQALKLDTTDAYRAAIWFNFGQVAEKQHKLKQARRAYRKANKLRPSKAAKKALDSVTKKLAK
ncbi:MAG: tetratricopeptide (TPR) repeat protein [Myxococcota bacterium]|jgi:tetratricopeptide (TPR) repeat protein